MRHSSRNTLNGEHIHAGTNVETGKAEYNFSVFACCRFALKNTMLVKAYSRAFRRLRIKLSLVHARDRNAAEHAGLRERVAVHKSLCFGASLHVDDQQAADELLAVITGSCSRNNQDALLATQILYVGLHGFFTIFGEVWRSYARDGPEHGCLLSLRNTWSPHFASNNTVTFSLRFGTQSETSIIGPEPAFTDDCFRPRLCENAAGSYLPHFIVAH